MQKKGITREIIYQAAAQLIVEKGYDHFSIRELAARLGVKPASLYSHVKNVQEINIAVGENAICQMSDVLEKAINEKDADTAFIKFAEDYRNFAHKNPELYRAIMALPGASETTLKEEEQKTIIPLRRLVERYLSNEKNVINFQRYLRSAIHGFIMLESSGFMRNKKIPADESYAMLIQVCLDQIKKAKETELPSDKDER